MKKEFIVLVQYKNDVPVVAAGVPILDSEYNVYVALSDRLKEAHITSIDNYFKAVKKSLAFNKDYKVKKFYL